MNYSLELTNITGTFFMEKKAEEPFGSSGMAFYTQFWIDYLVVQGFYRDTRQPHD